MPCASPTTLTPNRSIVPRKGQLFEIDVGLLREQKQCESSGRSTRTPRHPCAIIVHMFVADDISPVKSAIPASVYRPSADVSRVVAPCRPSREPLSIWATVTWRFDVAVGHSSVGRGVRAAVQELTDDLSHVTTGSDLGRILTELELLARAVEAATISVLARADRTEAFRDDGHGTLTGWARSLIKWSPSEASARARTALASHEYPQLVERLRGGTLGIAQSRRLASLHANRRVRDELPIVLKTSTPRCCVGSNWPTPTARIVMPTLCTTIVMPACIPLATPCTSTHMWARHKAPSSSRSSSATSRPNCATIWPLATPWGSPPCPIFHAPPPNGAPTRCTPSSAVRPRGPRRRPIRWSTSSSTPTRTKPPCAPWKTTSVFGVARSVLLNRVASRRCTPIAECATNSPSFSAREAVWLRRRRCVWPSCSRMHCEVDHRIPWSEGGRTSPDNGDPLCAKHNRWKTRGYRTHMNPHTKAIDVMRPDGSIISPV
ncbi:MAG: HNH endonuclease [Actinobacteria bacterium]|nr:HNH endonuclease [Actinomycetota bacterium]